MIGTERFRMQRRKQPPASDGGSAAAPAGADPRLAADAARTRVVFLAGSLPLGGAERVILTLLRHLDRRQFEPHLVLLRATGEFVGEVPADVPVHVLTRSTDARCGFVAGVLAAARLVWTIWRLRPRTVLAMGGMGIAAMAARPLLPRRLRLVLRECAVVSARLATETRRPWLWRSLYRCLYRGADAVICHSDAMVEDARRTFRLPHRRFLRIANPLDLARVREGAAAESRGGERAGPRLVAAGRLSREKGLDILLGAMPLVLRRRPEARLDILGCGPLAAALSAQARRLGIGEQVRFLGFRSNPWPHLRQADLLVLPSRRESFGNVVLEALALGTPAVVSDCPGALREIYGGVAAVRFAAPEDPQALAAAILQSLAAERVPVPGADWLAAFAPARILEQYASVLLGPPLLRPAAGHLRRAAA